MSSQIIFLADRVALLIDGTSHILAQREGIKAHLERLSGTFFNPELVALFKNFDHIESFWIDLNSPNEPDFLRKLQLSEKVRVGVKDLKKIAELFAEIIDKKSPWTHEHSIWVSRIARGLAKKCGFSPYQSELMEVTGFLHDLGKLAVPDEVIDKPGMLTPAELCHIRAHTYHTYNILKKIRGLESVRDWAAFHHERLDGKGYPFHLDYNVLSLGSRIMAVADQAQALSQARPYRSSLAKTDRIRILAERVRDKALDGELVELLTRHYDDLVSPEQAA